MHQKAQHQNTFLKAKYATNNKALLYQHAKSLQSLISHSLRPHGLCPQAPLSTGLSGRNTAVGCQALPPGGLPDPRTEPRSIRIAGGFFTESPGKPQGPHILALHFPSPSQL